MCAEKNKNNDFGFEANKLNQTTEEQQKQKI